MVWQRPGLSGNPGWVRSSAWIWLFSSSDRMGRRIDIEPDDVGQLGGKTWIARALEGAQPVRLQLVRPPDALDRTQRNADGFGHRPAGPVGRLVRRLGAGQRHHPGRGYCRQRRLARLAGLVAQQTVNPALGKALQRHTVGRLTPTLCATCCTEYRSAEASTMRARSICLRCRLRSAAIAANCSRSAVLNTTHTCCAMAPSPHAMA